MRPLTVRSTGLLALVGLAAMAPPLAGGTATAQAGDSAVAAAPRPAYEPPRVAFSVGVGTLGVTELQTQAVTVERLDDAGAPTESASLDRTLAAERGVSVGASALLGLTPAWAIRAGLSWGTASLGQGFAGDDRWEEAAEGLTPGASTDLTMLAAESAFRFRMRSGRRMQPHLEIGMGAVRMEAGDPSYPGAGALTGETRVGLLAGFGAIFPLWRRIAGRAQATGLFFANPTGLADAGSAVAAGDTLRVRFDAPEAGAFADPARELMRALRLEVGLSLEVGRVARPSVAPAAPPPDSRP